MAGASTSFASNFVRSTVIKSPRNNRTGDSFSVRISAKSNEVSATWDERIEGPYYIYVGPLETAGKETLEALYSQARAAYYSGEPLIVDDMFDRIELKLRWYGSKSVAKYPRCSIRRQTTFADAEVLQGLWRNDLVALMGACPNCGAEVFAFVRMDRTNDPPLRADCLVCESLLEFRTKVGQSVSTQGRHWVYGRIYLVSVRGKSRRQRWL